jgi:hypothetical protein
MYPFCCVSGYQPGYYSGGTPQYQGYNYCYGPPSGHPTVPNPNNCGTPDQPRALLRGIPLIKESGGPLCVHHHNEACAAPPHSTPMRRSELCTVARRSADANGVFGGFRAEMGRR